MFVILCADPEVATGERAPLEDSMAFVAHFVLVQNWGHRCSIRSQASIGLGRPELWFLSSFNHLRHLASGLLASVKFHV